MACRQDLFVEVLEVAGGAPSISVTTATPTMIGSGTDMPDCFIGSSFVLGGRPPYHGPVSWTTFKQSAKADHSDVRHIALLTALDPSHVRPLGKRGCLIFSQESVRPSR